MHGGTRVFFTQQKGNGCNLTRGINRTTIGSIHDASEGKQKAGAAVSKNSGDKEQNLISNKLAISWQSHK